MKYSIEKYKEAYETARRSTCLSSEIDALTRPHRILLYQGLEVGDGVTVNLYSDSYAGTIIKRTKCVLWIRRDHAFRIDKNGMSDCQEYRYERNPNGTIYQARWSEKRGCFIFGGSKDGKAISVGRHEYFDYSF